MQCCITQKQKNLLILLNQKTAKPKTNRGEKKKDLLKIYTFMKIMTTQQNENLKLQHETR